MNTLRDTNVSTAEETLQADALREAMVAELRRLKAIRSDQVADAFRAVPRHLFAAGEPLENAYAANSSVITKRDEHGIAISTVSAAHIQATMLEQAQLHPGLRVLEIGSGGCNAALIAELVGETGKVTTVDIDPDVVDRARDCLAAAGYRRVNVVLADAEGGVPGHAPYDRVIVTVGAWDIPPAWSDQLAEGGRIVVPFRMRGLTRSVVFERDGDHLMSRGHLLCGFVPMQGVGAHTERLILLDGEKVVLRVDGPDKLDADRLRDALFQPKVERWSGVEIGGFEPFDELDLWLATVVDGFGLLAAKKEAIDSGLVAASTRMGAKTIVAGGTFAYRAAARPVDEDRTRFEFGAYAHGPEAAALADQYVKLIRTWDRDHRGGAGARIEVYPAAIPDAELPPGRVMDKKHTRVVISWP
ncbi:MAG: methyltransferase, FxLD system [Egibacteraceae bacterium]